MAWWNKKVMCPVKRAWIAIAAGRAKPPEHDDGISKLHDEVQTCQYEDVQVMWEMLNRSKMEMPRRDKSPKRHSWRLPCSSRRTSSCDSM
ncbi:uncharacterized protein LOC122013720 [Zingiber officinale]|uniref:uncharacterized protein LOC122013720 n=1 Tax=Zingiber officinale TaxID=94328 RepID=UPI001C4D24B8|nr:uncharacterized protein LOC122013720 [Zingiber officinale]